VKRLSVRNGRYYYSLSRYSLLRVLSFESFAGYFREAPAGEVALDYGAGDRPYEEMVRTKYARYVAVDHVATRSGYGGKAPDILLNGESLPLEDVSVDCVILTEVLEHIYDPGPVLKDLIRVLKPGGTILGTVPFAIQLHDEPYDYHRYTCYSLREMFVKSGLHIKHLNYVGDMVAVGITVSVSILDLLPKGLEKVHMRLLATALRRIFRLPLFGYYYACKLGFNPSKVRYFKRYPLGFTFCCTKP